MGAMTTMKELAKLWQEMTPDERLDYRVRLDNDVFEIISIEETDDDQAMVRGYQLNGPMATTQRQDLSSADGGTHSQAARVKMVSIHKGGVEILDRDEPVDRDDPGPPPPIMRLVADGSYEQIEPPSETQSSEIAEPVVYVEQPDLVEQTPLPDFREVAPPDDHWAGDPDYAPKPPSGLETPVDEWVSTGIRAPREVLDRASNEAKRRGIGRNVLIAHLLDQGLNGLEGRPIL